MFGRVKWALSENSCEGDRVKLDEPPGNRVLQSARYRLYDGGKSPGCEDGILSGVNAEKCRVGYHLAGAEVAAMLGAESAFVGDNTTLQKRGGKLRRAG